MIIRQEVKGDEPQIHALTKAAFATAEHSSGTEQDIIAKLRADGALSLSLVGEVEGQIVAHLAFTAVEIGGRDLSWLGLGPVSVAPDQQSNGFGRAIIEDGLRDIAAKGAKGCVVLGEPTYYSKFGFKTESGLIFEGVPPEYFMALVFEGELPKGNVTYHSAFYI